MTVTEHEDKIQNPIDVTVFYEIELRSPGGKNHFDAGTWFQESPLIQRRFSTYDEAHAALTQYRIDGRYRYLRARITQTVSTTNAVTVHD